jgi:hypothetical protein
MKTPFSTEEFFSVIEKYNTSVSPIQFVFSVLGMLMLWKLISQKSKAGKFSGISTGILWLWMGVVYHLLFFTSINRVAFIFGSLFVLQGIFILFETHFRNRFSSQTKQPFQFYTGYFLAVYGIVLYPLINYFPEGSIAKTIAFGLPCPTTIFTFGLLLIYAKHLPRYLIIIPTLWAFLGISAALNFGVYQDFVMILAALIVNFWLLIQNSELYKSPLKTVHK